MRIENETNPFPTVSMPSAEMAPCPARWVWHPDARPGEPSVVALRLRFALAEATQVRLHASADQRYELWLDGRRLGRGPQRGEPAHWFFETYLVDLEPGEHLLAAKAWWLPGDAAPMAQMTLHPGFLLLAEDELAETLSTGSGAWEALAIDAYEQEPAHVPGYHVVGWSFRMDGARYPWGWNSDPDCAGPWAAPAVVEAPVGGASNPYYALDLGGRQLSHCLTPATLPPMMEMPRRLGMVRGAESGGAESGDAGGGSARSSAEGGPMGERAARRAAPTDGGRAVTIDDGLVSLERHDVLVAGAWQRLLAGREPITVPAGTRQRVLIDLEDYYCAYPEIVTSGGRGATITVGWAESLFTEPDPASIVKGNRDDVAGKYFRAPRDRFLLNGDAACTYDTLWWRAGRYVEIVVEAAEEPVTIEAVAWRETRYPLEMRSTFRCSDGPLDAATPIMFRALQMCSHETYMDCPYYEQLMYVGDTRLQALVTYVTTDDARLPETANRLFDWSRAPDGITKSRFPSAVPQVIPPFSLLWVGMVHDAFMWRDRPDLVREWLPGVDAVLAGFRQYLSDEGLVVAPRGWNYCDWVPEWPGGWPPGGRDGPSALINLMYAYALQRAAEMHAHFGEDLLAWHLRSLAARVSLAVRRTFWDDARGLLADDPAHAHYSEHTQAFAILTGLVHGEERDRLVDGLLTEPDLARATIYFSHYLFEAYRAVGAMDALFARLDLWRGLAEQGFKTTLEKPEPSRSDCHAWGAHPIYHYYATILGARPAAPGFRAIHVAPQFGPLTWVSASMPHPSGEMIVFDLRIVQDDLRGRVILPQGLSGTLAWRGRDLPLSPGVNDIA